MTSMRSLALVLPLAAFALPAFADCPTAADMAQGIMVTFDNGDTTILRALGDEMIEVEEHYGQGVENYRYEARFGLFSVHEVALSPGGQPLPDSATNFTYPDGVTAFPAPDPAAPGWQGMRQVQEMGAQVVPQSYQFGFRPSSPLVIGACSYDAVAVGIRLGAGEADQKDQFSYFLPALGAGFIVTWVDEDGRHDTVPVAIATLP